MRAPQLTAADRARWPVGALAWKRRGARGWLAVRVTGYFARYIRINYETPGAYTPHNPRSIPRLLVPRTDGEPRPPYDWRPPPASHTTAGRPATLADPTLYHEECCCRAGHNCRYHAALARIRVLEVDAQAFARLVHG